MPYLRRRYRVTAEGEDLAVADLWAAGTLGIESTPEAAGTVVLTAWFEADGQAPAVALSVAAAEHLADDEPPETDWMAEYRRRVQPFALGRRLWIDPREPDDSLAEATEVGAAGRFRLQLPARTAFGIGSHESTSLALELLEAEPMAGRRILDVGTGTGILAFAAQAWGAAEVVAFDVDPVAAFQARVNSALNGLTPRLFAGRLAGLRPARAFDLALANVIPEQILPELDDLLGLLGAGAAILLSGLLAARETEVAAVFAARGWTVTARRQAGEWAALRLAGLTA